jgi:tight adherence protein B
MFGACLLLPRARAMARLERWARFLPASQMFPGTSRPSDRVSHAEGVAGRSESLTQGQRSSSRGVPALRLVTGRRLFRASALALVGWILGSFLAPPIGGIGGALAFAIFPRVLDRRRERKREEAIERQLAELSEATAQAVRSGLSVAQSLDFAVGESENPLRELLGKALVRQALGVPLEEALRGFGDEIDTDDIRLLVLVVGIHARSGGDLGGALDEVARTIRHRIAVRRELRALSAQGRVSGAILGSLPIAFFLVLSITSRRDLDPVLRSPAGMAMVGVGLLLQGLAFLWIRRLLRVPV